MPSDGPDRTTDAGRPGPQMTNDPGRSPGTPAGSPPAPNESQTDLGTGYTLLRGGQDVRQPGYYFNEATQEVRWWETGQQLGGERQGEHWLYLSDDVTAPEERIESLIRERGYGGPLDRMQVKPAAQ